MHICFPSLSYPLNGESTSGVGAQVQLLAQGLLERGNSVSVVDLSDQPVMTTDNRGAQVHRVRAGKLHWYISKLPIIGKTFALPVRELEYGIAVWHGVSRANESRKINVIEGTETGMLLLALFWRKCPVIVRLHGEQYTFHKYTPEMALTPGVRLSRVLQRIALRRVKLLISPSYAHAREIHEELGGSHPPIVAIPNSIASTSRELNGHKLNSKVVLYAGRIEKRKGIGTFLRAAAQTRDALPESRFVFAGDFHSSFSRSEFQHLVQANHLDDNIDLLGPVDRKTLMELYRRAAVAVLPSHYETFGLAALEPMAFGTPVVASNNSALVEVVVPEVNGKLVASGDASALASALIELLNDPRACARMGQAAIEHAATFDVRKTLPLTERLYSWCEEEAFSEGPSHVFFSAHPDDAVLSCGGVIASLVSQQKSVRVITAFAGDSAAAESAFARHLHAKWGTPANAAQQRRQEDSEALRQLGVNVWAHWDYVEASARRAADGNPLYATYDELRGELADEDAGLVDVLARRILSLDIWSADAVLYFPLSLGHHVDHQILFGVGRQLSAAGKTVRFYEDYPYAESYDAGSRELNWLPRTVAIPFQTKLKAISAYETQINGLGGTLKKLERRLRAFSSRLSTTPSERYWELVPSASYHHNGKVATAGPPLTTRSKTPRLSDFKRFISTFRWHDLDEVLPSGDGDCIDVGCGPGRHRSLIERRGYRWFGFDRAGMDSCVAACDAAALSARTESQAAVVAWQVLEYVERPDRVFAEAARVLEPGGVFCGSVSFLEPVHGRTYFNLSPLILEKLLRQHGFADIEIRAGLNGFALMLWTCLRRSGIPFASRLANPIAFLMFVPLSACLFFFSWWSWRIGFGTGHLMRWLSQTAPLEFAGHVMFTARKRARVETCTSPS